MPFLQVGGKLEVGRDLVSISSKVSNGVNLKKDFLNKLVVNALDDFTLLSDMFTQKLNVINFKNNVKTENIFLPI